MSEPQREVVTTDAAESAPVVSPEAETPTLADNLANLEELLRVLPDYDGTDAGLRRKYGDLTPRELERVYPILRSIRTKEMFSALDEAIAHGKQIIEVVPAGEPLDLSRYSTPGDTIQPVAHRASPLGSGMVEYSVVCFDRVGYPEVWLRSYEETWVHDRMDEAGLCKEGDDSH